MKQTTLVFLIDVTGTKVVLAMKKRGFGVGKWNGVGGKVLPGEDVRAAAVREAKEEIDVTILPEVLETVGSLNFSFEGNPEWEQECSVFLTRAWMGEPTESEEMRPQWCDVNALPFESMWIDDPHWLPLVLVGKKIKGEFLFNATGDVMLRHDVNEI